MTSHEVSAAVDGEIHNTRKMPSELSTKIMEMGILSHLSGLQSHSLIVSPKLDREVLESGELLQQSCLREAH